jgi:hypothetical protein
VSVYKARKQVFSEGVNIMGQRRGVSHLLGGEAVNIIEARCAEKAIAFTPPDGSLPDIAVRGDKRRLKQVLLCLLAVCCASRIKAPKIAD